MSLKDILFRRKLYFTVTYIYPLKCRLFSTTVIHFSDDFEVPVKKILAVFNENIKSERKLLIECST